VNGRVGLEGTLSSLYYEFIRLVRVARTVPLAFARAEAA